LLTTVCRASSVATRVTNHRERRARVRRVVVDINVCEVDERAKFGGLSRARPTASRGRAAFAAVQTSLTEVGGAGPICPSKANGDQQAVIELSG
jgi:hypothetical protein